jgi:hypothetical protein
MCDSLRGVFLPPCTIVARFQHFEQEFHRQRGMSVLASAGRATNYTLGKENQKCCMATRRTMERKALAFPRTGKMKLASVKQDSSAKLPMRRDWLSLEER